MLESFCAIFKKKSWSDSLKIAIQVHMTDFLGEFNYLGTVLRQRNLEPQVSLHDVRRVVTEYCILPMGSQKASLF